MSENKSKYESMLEEIIANSNQFYLTDEQNLQVLKDLSVGMEDFLYKEKKIEAASEMELTGLVLNA
jgi:hypothetical protein